MKILMISHSDLNGGAARASLRIFQALSKYGIDVKMLVKQKLSDEDNIKDIKSFYTNKFLMKIDSYHTKIENLYYKRKLNQYKLNEDQFISNLSSINLNRALNTLEFDIIHLNWISHQFVDLDVLLGLNKPIVWTLHDCWAFTGICHYFDQCTHYTESCGSCRLLNSENTKDLSHEIWRKKSRVYDGCNMQIITPSKWLRDSVAQSSLLHKKPVSVIPYPINTDIFKPIDKITARSKLGLDQNNKYVLFGAMNATTDQRKGYDYLLKAIKILLQKGKTNLQVIVFGSVNAHNESTNGYPIIYYNTIWTDSDLINFYNAVDVTVVPSLSENLSLVIMESLACSTPVVAFNVGGNADMIDHKINGYIASNIHDDDLAKGIEWCLEEVNTDYLKVEARRKVVDNFKEDIVANQYVSMYNNMIRLK